MASVRGGVSFEGINAVYETFKIDNSTITHDATKERGSAEVDLAVTLSADDTVALAGDGEVVIGRLERVESDDRCSVQTHGITKLPGGTSATLTVGTKIMGDLLVSAKGYIQTVGTGSVAAESAGRGRIINNDTTTAVVVDLDG